MDPKTAFYFAIGLAVGCNFVCYAAKVFLLSKGKRVHWFTHHFQDFRSLRDLAKQDTNPLTQLAARRWLVALILAVAAFVLVVVPVFIWGAAHLKTP